MRQSAHEHRVGRGKTALEYDSLRTRYYALLVIVTSYSHADTENVNWIDASENLNLLQLENLLKRVVILIPPDNYSGTKAGRDSDTA